MRGDRDGGCERQATDLDDVLVPELAEELDLPDGRHVKSVLELADLDLLDGDFASGGNLTT